MRTWQDDGPLVLPDVPNATNCEYVDAEPDDIDSDWSEDEDDSLAVPSFPELMEQIGEQIQVLGGDVFPKLNWSAPRDASWMSPSGTTKCQGAGDIILLLKSSEFIAHDLTLPYEGCIDFAPGTEEQGAAAVAAAKLPMALVLRRWENIATCVLPGSSPIPVRPPGAACRVPRAACRVPRAACCVLRAACCVLHAACRVPRAASCCVLRPASAPPRPPPACCVLRVACLLAAGAAGAAGGRAGGVAAGGVRAVGVCTRVVCARAARS